MSRGIQESPVNFATWLTYGLPIALANIAILWAWFLVIYVGPRLVAVCRIIRV